MRTDRFVLRGWDGARLSGVFWHPEVPVRAAIIFVHGIGEHTLCYRQWVQGFCAAGFVCGGVDHRGHGNSPGMRGHTSYQHFERDLALLLRKVQHRFPDCPVLLYGHSMGGALVLRFCKEHPDVPLTGVIASSAVLGLTRLPVSLLRPWVYLASAVLPFLRVKTGIRREQLASVSIEKSTRTDPLMHKYISMRVLADLFRTMRRLSRGAGPFPFPLLLLHGTDDSVCCASCALAFGARMGRGTLTKLWPGRKHELHRDAGAAEVQRFIVGWIKKILSDGYSL